MKTRTFWVFLSLCALTLFLVSCADDTGSGGGDSNPLTGDGSCTLTLPGSLVFCIGYENVAITYTSALQSGCTTENYDTYGALEVSSSSSFCSSVNAIGTCAIAGSDGAPTQYHVYYPAYTALAAEWACDTASGTWTAASMSSMR